MRTTGRWTTSGARARPTSTPSTTRARRPARARPRWRSRTRCRRSAPWSCPWAAAASSPAMAVALKARLPDVRVVAVQPDASPALRDSLAAGRALTDYDAGPTLADGLAGGIGMLVWEHRDLIDDVVTVSEAEIEAAIVALAAHDQVIAEGSGADRRRRRRRRPHRGRRPPGRGRGHRRQPRRLRPRPPPPALVTPERSAAALAWAEAGLVCLSPRPRRRRGPGLAGRGGGGGRRRLARRALGRARRSREARRRAAAAAPFPERWRAILAHRYDHYDRLPESLRPGVRGPGPGLPGREAHHRRRGRRHRRAARARGGLRGHVEPRLGRVPVGPARRGAALRAGLRPRLFVRGPRARRPGAPLGHDHHLRPHAAAELRRSRRRVPRRPARVRPPPGQVGHALRRHPPRPRRGAEPRVDRAWPSARWSGCGRGGR